MDKGISASPPVECQKCGELGSKFNPYYFCDQCMKDFEDQFQIDTYMQGRERKITFMRHLVGPMVGLKQTCELCGAVISDYSNTMTSFGSPPISGGGYPDGDVFVSNTNPMITTILVPEDELNIKVRIIDCCKPLTI